MSDRESAFTSTSSVMGRKTVRTGLTKESIVEVSGKFFKSVQPILHICNCCIGPPKPPGDPLADTLFCFIFILTNDYEKGKIRTWSIIIILKEALFPGLLLYMQSEKEQKTDTLGFLNKQIHTKSLLYLSYKCTQSAHLHASTPILTGYSD